MITNANTAKRISDLMLDISGQLDESVATVKRTCPPEEFESYRRTVGRILGQVLLNVLNPLYAEHPTLKPPGLE
jgi:hypothetical protein